MESWHGAHDADRTRDLVLTKDVLYQLSYVGIFRAHRQLPTAIPSIHLNERRFPSDAPHSQHLERAVGVEPTTASLEGWDSTAELRPR